MALPEADEECVPSFVHHASDRLPFYEAGGIAARLIVGNAFGASSPVQGNSRLFYVHFNLEAGAITSVPGGYSERAVYVVSGEIEIANRVFRAGQMLVFTPGSQPTLKALVASTLMMLGGEPVGARHIWWNFVSSRQERIDQAAADWKAGRFMLPPGDDHEFIPLPERP